jgi:hypothetical protein
VGRGPPSRPSVVKVPAGCLRPYDSTARPAGQIGRPSPGQPAPLPRPAYTPWGVYEAGGRPAANIHPPAPRSAQAGRQREGDFRRPRPRPRPAHDGADGNRPPSRRRPTPTLFHPRPGHPVAWVPAGSARLQGGTARPAGATRSDQRSTKVGRP